MAEIKIPGSLSLVHTPDNAHILKSLPPPAPPPKARSNPIKFTVKTVPTPHNTIYCHNLSLLSHWNIGNESWAIKLSLEMSEVSFSKPHLDGIVEIFEYTKS